MMRSFMAVALLAVMVAGATSAREAARPDTKPLMGIDAPRISLDRGPDVPGLRASAPGETTWLASWTFDMGPNCTEQGWVSVDITGQDADFTHIDDFAGLGGGSFGHLNPLEGNQSVWCGARPSGPIRSCATTPHSPATETAGTRRGVLPPACR